MANKATTYSAYFKNNSSGSGPGSGTAGDDDEEESMTSTDTTKDPGDRLRKKALKRRLSSMKMKKES